MRVLLVEDDNRVARALGDVLIRHGFQVVRAAGAAEALGHFETPPDVVLLDLGLPDGDGFDVIRAIRACQSIPIIVVTARAEVRWRLHGLNLGADDYIVKPYDVRELMARIRAVVRRSGPTPGEHQPDQQTVIEIKGVRIDLMRREVRTPHSTVTLTRKEFDLLEVLAATPGIVVRREQLLSRVWQSPHQSYAHTLDVHVAAVRSKTGVPGLIETVRGVGYRLASA